MIALSLAAVGIWVAVLLMPSRPYGTTERLEAGPVAGESLGDVTVLIPARNEERTIGRTLRAILQQGEGLEIVVVDDESTDDTRRIVADIAGRSRATDSAAQLTLVDGKPVPAGWSGKLWALEQGLAHAERPYTLLLDADIVVARGFVGVLRRQLREGGYGMVSIMAKLPVESFWEKLLVPPFIFFFKLLYPFRSVSDSRSSVAAAAGGCILVETRRLRDSGAFSSLRNELIDDCALARRVKDRGVRIWLGLSDAVASTRSYTRLAAFWNMVARTAFSQLRYSALLLVGTTFVMTTAFWIPILALGSSDLAVSLTGAVALGLQFGVFVPVLRFYGLSPLRAWTLPVAALLFLLMAWSSAGRYWSGTRATWKNRAYGTSD